MLRDAHVDVLIDVRAFPRSRTNPAFNLEFLPAFLGDHQIGYEHMPALGGRRPRQFEVDASCNALWRVSSFHNYADYALGDVFQEALTALVLRGETAKSALMCSEAVWWRCHRRIIVDYLLFNGHPVQHLMAPGRSQAANPTPGAVFNVRKKVLYPAQSERRPEDVAT